MKIQETLFELEPIQEAPEEDYIPESYVKGGIYIDKGADVNDPNTEFMISFGRAVHVIFNGICHIDEIVEMGGLHNMELVDGYTLSFNKRDKTWKIKDTGSKQCRHILQSGTYKDGFVESIKPYLRIFHK